eukprot:CAMPEP_0168601716 /NCGR_PEP_ID=MMETSP0420-20121227/13610_1 /TAXON_ID=498008 /ORGANISM="Pessonella sp." /LENGTH=207 /DNA_ID=CAMNT_0008640181 /DNA_START=220 /DNA_END=839 /DNA_ORIENTATION=-
MGSAFSLVPDRPIRRGNYLCDKQFHLDELRALQIAEEEEEFVAVAIVNGRETSLFKVSNLQQILLEKIGTTTQKNHKKGGMSQARVGRLRQNKAQHNATYVVERIAHHLLDEQQRCVVAGVVIGGAAGFHDKVATTLPDALQPFVICSVAFSGSHAPDLLEQCAQQITQYKLTRERNLLQELTTLMETEPELLDYGFDNIMRNMSHG